MHQPYKDILDEITSLISSIHNDWMGEYNSFPSDCASYPRADEHCSCVAKPLWWDENGVPRFALHHPHHCPDIYAEEVCLLLVSCQNCEKEFQVQMSWNATAHLRGIAALMRMGIAVDIPAAAEVVKSSLAYQIAGRGPHYGDPPHHDGCLVGNTMNVWDLRVLEFWRRGEGVITYVRVPELEIALPDLSSTERLGPS